MALRVLILSAMRKNSWLLAFLLTAGCTGGVSEPTIVLGPDDAKADGYSRATIAISPGRESAIAIYCNEWFSCDFVMEATVSKETIDLFQPIALAKVRDELSQRWKPGAILPPEVGSDASFQIARVKVERSDGQPTAESSIQAVFAFAAPGRWWEQPEIARETVRHASGSSVYREHSDDAAARFTVTFSSVPGEEAAPWASLDVIAKWR